MNILYAIQGTGNGHLSRARDLIPALLDRGVSLDLLVSGTQSDLSLPYPVRYRFKGMSFVFGKQGGVDFWQTCRKANSLRVQKEVRTLPVWEYDLVLNDFEPVSAWACKLNNIPCIGVSHQAAVLSPAAPQPARRDPVGLFVLKNYAPVSHQYGFHFQAYEEGMFTPIIRKGIREASVGRGEHYTVYLPAYSDPRIVSVLSQVSRVPWQVFSKHNSSPFQRGNVLVRPIQHEAFLESIAGCRGVLCAAGFETPSEALFLGKKLCVVPMKNQYEQQCNAVALAQMGIPVLEGLSGESLPALHRWVGQEEALQVSYPDIAGAVVDRVLGAHAPVYA